MTIDVQGDLLLESNSAIEHLVKKVDQKGLQTEFRVSGEVELELNRATLNRATELTGYYHYFR